MIRMCKKKFLVLFLVLMIAVFQVAFAQVSQKKIATLGPDEYIVTDESVLLACTGPGCAVDDFFLVTHTSRSGKNQYFTYDKSGRKGPFDKITPEMLRKGAGCPPRKPFYEAEFSNEGVEVNPDPNDRTKQYMSLSQSYVMA